MTTKVKPAFPTTEGLTVTSGYGWRVHPITGEDDFHAAIDIGGGGVNHPIFATQSGEVIYNQSTSYGGWTVRIKHEGDNYYSQYQHLASKSPIPIGTKVGRGEQIGTMGDTGDSTGIHLDFAISTNGTFFHSTTTIDPLVYLEMSFGGGEGTSPTPKENATDKKTQYEYEKEGSVSDMVYIEVKKGDNLSTIAKKYDIPLNSIKRVRFEDIKNKSLLYPGEVLKLPLTPKRKPIIYYTVKAGDNLTKIAKRHNTTPKKLAIINDIDNPNIIHVGQKLRIE